MLMLPLGAGKSAGCGGVSGSSRGYRVQFGSGVPNVCTRKPVEAWAPALSLLCALRCDGICLFQELMSRVYTPGVLRPSPDSHVAQWFNCPLVIRSWAPVVHAYNPSYSGGSDQKDLCLRTTPGK
jgi:hypothetical protein